MTPIDVFTLEGSPYARGLELGIARRMRIQSCIADWLGGLSAVGIGNPKQYLAQMLDDTDFDRSCRELAPDLMEEVRGLADGAEQPFSLVFAAQLMDEEWAYRSKTLRNADRLEKCSSAAIRMPDGSIAVGQNMDLPNYTTGHQILLRVSPVNDNPAVTVYSISSMMALMGVNACQIAVCVNSLRQLPGNRQGVPVAFMIRMLLQATTLEDATRIVQETPHASGQNYLIADSANFRSFEASAEGVVEYKPSDPTGIFHTNHSLAVPNSDSSVRCVDSTERLNALRKRLKTTRPDLESVKAALASEDDLEHPICRTGKLQNKTPPSTGVFTITVGSMISVLRRQAKDIEMWISPGPPSIHGYSRLVMPVGRNITI
jgi:isopenicillin-N N-acyltransferase like protein